MSTTTRQSIGPQRNPDSQKAILDAAQELLAEKGLGGFSIEEVARRARAGKPTIYRWWPTKTQLLLEVYGRIKEKLAQPDSGSLEGDVAGFLINVFAFWRTTEAGQIFRSVFAGSPGDPDAQRALVEYHQNQITRTATLFLRPHGTSPTPTPAQAQILAETAASYALVQLIMNKLDTTDSELQIIATQMIQGLSNH